MKQYIIKGNLGYYQGGMWTNETSMAMTFDTLNACKAFCDKLSERYKPLEILEVMP